MKRFILEQSDREFYTSHSGLALIGLCVNTMINLGKTLKQTLSLRHKEFAQEKYMVSFTRIGAVFVACRCFDFHFCDHTKSLSEIGCRIAATSVFGVEFGD